MFKMLLPDSKEVHVGQSVVSMRREPCSKPFMMILLGFLTPPAGSQPSQNGVPNVRMVLVYEARTCAIVEEHHQHIGPHSVSFSIMLQITDLPNPKNHPR